MHTPRWLKGNSKLCSRFFCAKVFRCFKANTGLRFSTGRECAATRVNVNERFTSFLGKHIPAQSAVQPHAYLMANGMELSIIDGRLLSCLSAARIALLRSWSYTEWLVSESEAISKGIDISGPHDQLRCSRIPQIAYIGVLNIELKCTKRSQF